MSDLRERLARELVARGERRTAEFERRRREAERRRASDEARAELARRWEEGRGRERG